MIYFFGLPGQGQNRFKAVLDSEFKGQTTENLVRLLYNCPVEENRP